MKEVYKIINQLRSTTSLNEKEEILRKNKDNELLKKVLKYTYDYRYQFNMSSSKLPEITAPSILFPVSIDEVFDFLDKMRNKGATDKDRFAFINMIKSLGPEAEEIFKCIIDKDLREAGINVETINKVFGEDFVKKYKVMLAQSQDKLEEFLENFKSKEIYVNYKYDGIRCIAEINLEDDSIVLWSRNGRVYNFPSLNKYILESINREKLCNVRKITLDGEITIKDMEFRDVMKIARREHIDEESRKILDAMNYNVFDIILDKHYEIPLYIRVEQLKDIINENNMVKKVKYWSLKNNNIDEVLKEFDKSQELGYEGLILKNSESEYIRSKSINWIKVKKTDNIDCTVVELIEGTGKYKNSLGALVCRMENGVCFNLGTGFDEEFRDYYWKHKNEIIGKTVEVKIYGFIKDRPRNPVFVRIRDDK